MSANSRDRRNGAQPGRRMRAAIPRSVTRPPRGKQFRAARAFALSDRLSSSRGIVGRGGGPYARPYGENCVGLMSTAEAVPTPQLSFFVVPNGRRLCCCLCTGWRGLQMPLRLSDQRREAFGIHHGHVRQNLAVEFNAGELQAVNQLAVGEAVVA